MKTLFNLILFFGLVTSITAAPTYYVPALKVNGNVVAHNSSLIGINSNGVQFELDYSASALTSGPLKVFYEFGDGNYSTLFDPYHVYASSVAGQTIEVKVHTIDDYDDEEEDEEEEYPAPQTYRFTITFDSSFSAALARTPSGNTGLNLWRSWDIVKDQNIYFVATDYSCSSPNSSTIAEFEYDSSYFKDSITVTIGSNTFQQVGVLQGSGNYKASFEYKGLSVDSTNILFGLKTKERLGRDATGCVQLSLFTDKNNPACETASSCGRVGKSHDPNLKEVLAIKNACDGSSNIEITYQIHFQNIGDGAAEFVTVEDYLDEFKQIVDIEFINSKHRITSAQPAAMTSAGNYGPHEYLRWHFIYNNATGQVLRGTKEPGIHIDFNEEDTKGWIQLKVIYKPNSIEKCNAILNKARIIFDCNAFINTKNAYAWENCRTSKDSCEKGCYKEKDNQYTKEEGLRVKAGNNLISGALPTNITSVNWYPDQGLDQTNPQNPIAKPLENTSYTGVYVDRNCQRYIYHVDVIVPHQGGNGLQVHAVNGEAVVIGGSPEYNWSNSHTGSALSLGSIASTVTITDNHGCTTTYTPSTGGGSGGFSFVTAAFLIGILLVAGIFLFLRFRNKS